MQNRKIDVSDRALTTLIGKQLRKAREFLCYQPWWAGKHLGVGAVRIREFETGKVRPTLKQLEKLARLYGRELDYFLAETPPSATKTMICRPEDIDERGI